MLIKSDLGIGVVTDMALMCGDPRGVAAIMVREQSRQSQRGEWRLEVDRRGNMKGS